jgi:hypothetical protein
MKFKILSAVTEPAQKFGQCLDRRPISSVQASTPCTGDRNMAHMLEYPRPCRVFARADILSNLGETICGMHFEIPTAKRREEPKPQGESFEYEEDPERWDGMS